MRTFQEYLEANGVNLDEKKWIPHDLKKGAFTDYCGGKVTDACIDKGEKSDNPTTRRRAVLAKTFRGMAHKKEEK